MQKFNTAQKFLSLSLLMLHMTCANATEVSLEISDIRTPNAQFYLAIYDAQTVDQWDLPSTLQLIHPLNEHSVQTLNFTLPEGNYALRAFVDLNGNGQLDFNQKSRPIEPFAFSIGDGRRAPSIHFKHAKVQAVGEQVTWQMKLLYPREAKLKLSEKQD